MAWRGIEMEWQSLCDPRWNANIKERESKTNRSPHLPLDQIPLELIELRNQFPAPTYWPRPRFQQLVRNQLLDLATNMSLLQQ